MISWEAMGALGMLICLSGGIVAIYGRALVAELHDEMHSGTLMLSARIDALTAKVEVQNGRLGKVENWIDGQEAQMMNLLQQHHLLMEGLREDLRLTRQAREEQMRSGQA